jgi:hypothetical protein
MLRPFYLFILILCSTSLLLGQTPQTALDKDFQRFCTWVTGEFNNYRQVQQELRDSIPATLVHEHLHTMIVPIQLPFFKGPTFFLKQYFEGNEDKLHRLRVYHMSVNTAEQAIQMDIYSLATKELELQCMNLYKNTEKAAELIPTFDKLKTVPGCEAYWKYQGDYFLGYVKAKACVFFSPRLNKQLFITDTLRLYKNQLWISDAATDEKGQYVFGHKARIPHKMYRCHYYEGTVSFSNANQQNGLGNSIKVRLHDQGQPVKVAAPDGTISYQISLQPTLFQRKAPLYIAVQQENKASGARLVSTSLPDRGLKKITYETPQVSIALVRQ